MLWQSVPAVLCKIVASPHPLAFCKITPRLGWRVDFVVGVSALQSIDPQDPRKILGKVAKDGGYTLVCQMRMLMAVLGSGSGLH